MNLSFTKMQGLGNDFMVVPANGHQPPSAGQIQRLADRRTGIGFDQLLWLEPARDQRADIYYRNFNADGSEAEQCGNGARCITRYLANTSTRDQPAVDFMLEHVGGLSPARVMPDGTISVALTVPDFRPAALPFKADREADSYLLATSDGEQEIRVVSVGNPHAVLVVDDVATAPVSTLGAELERHERFPNRANIGFLQMVTPDHVRLRVFERGVGETRACGTGACAAAVIGQRAGHLGEQVRVEMPGGIVTVSWAGPGTPVWLTGEAVTVFEGTVQV